MDVSYSFIFWKNCDYRMLFLPQMSSAVGVEHMGLEMMLSDYEREKQKGKGQCKSDRDQKTLLKTSHLSESLIATKAKFTAT